MKICHNCHVNIEDPRETCPLCQNPLSGSDAAAHWTFPFVPLNTKKHALLIRLLTFINLAGILISFVVNFFHQSGGWWSLIVLAGSAYFWVSVATILYNKNNLMNITTSVLILSLLLFIIDFSYGTRRWSTNYAIPSLMLAAIAAVVMISLIRGLRFSDFVIYIIITGLFAFIPLIFLLTGLARVAWPSISCVIAGILSLIAVFVFADQEIRDELRRRFHL